MSDPGDHGRRDPREEYAARGWAAVHVPGGFQPRAAVGHLTFAMLGALETGGLLPSLTEAVDEVVAELERAVAELGPEAPAERNPAKALAETIGDRIPVIWGIEGVASIAAMRWKTQMNENGKVPAFASAMSELDHNEVVGWTRPYGERCAVIGLRHDARARGLSPRFALSADIVRDAGATYDEVRVGTRSALATLFGFVVVGDFASCYVALRRGVDPTPVAVIAAKAALARLDVTSGLPSPGDDLPARCAEIVRARTDLIPSVGLVLGSGLGPAIGADLEVEASFAFTDLPGFPPPGVPGHAGTLSLGPPGRGPRRCVQRPRPSTTRVTGWTYPRCCHVSPSDARRRTMVLTASVEGSSPGWRPARWCRCADHLNMMGAAPLWWAGVSADGTPAFVEHPGPCTTARCAISRWRGPRRSASARPSASTPR